MAISGIDYIAVVTATVNAFVWSVAYYVVLFKNWREAAGWSAGEVRGRSSLATYVATFIGLLVMAWVLAAILSHLGPGHMNAKAGTLYAGLIWLGFVAPIIAINNVIGGRKYMLSVIDGVNWLSILLIEGAFIGVMSA